MDIRSGSRKQHDASIQPSSQSSGNLQTTTIANHFPQSNNFSLIFTVILKLILPSCRKEKTSRLRQAERAHLQCTHRIIAICRKNKILICNTTAKSWWLSVFRYIKKMNTFNNSPEKKTTAIMRSCY